VLGDLAGVRIEEFGTQNHADVQPLDFLIAGQRIRSSHFYEALRPTTAEVLATWDSRHLAGRPAATSRSLGRGRVIWVGTVLTRETLAALLPTLTRLSGLVPLVPGLPAGCTAARRARP
jgi:beta-galactosidase